MHLIETSISLRSQLPLPSATLIIDVRGIQDDEVIEWLSIELADLASEMKTYDVHHWRYLTDFISVQSIQTAPEDNHSRTNEGSYENESTSSLTGVANAPTPEDVFFFDELRTQIGAEDVPFNHFEQKIDELLQEIDRIRNNRIAAVKDLNHAAIPGRSSSDSTVRVIFLADLKYPESLSTAALYAERLKAYYGKLEKPNHQLLLNTTVLCLSNSGEAGPPTTLIQRLMRDNSWDHLDSLILSENYREDAAQIAGPVQAYIAELLLYVLLILPPLQVSSPAPETQNRADDLDTRVLGLPKHTFIVGLAAVEYSARWGRRWLSFGLAKEAANILRQKQPSNNKEKVRQADIATSWFQDWHGRVRQTLPDDVPGEIPALDGIFQAREVSDPQKQPFTDTHFNLHIGTHTLTNLNAYLASLAKTYTTNNNRSTLQDALSQSPGQIMQALRKKEDASAAERRIVTLGKLQIEAEQILKHPKFFIGATGALPRAQAQLEAVGTAISHFAQEHQNHPLNPLSMKDTLHYRQQELEKNGQGRIDQLKKHLDHWPFVSGTTFTKTLLGVLSFVLIIFMSVITVFLGFAWLHHLILQHLPTILTPLDTLLPGGFSIMEIIAGIVTLVVLVLGPASLWKTLVNKNNSPLAVEITFLASLIVLTFFGLFVSSSITNLGNLVNDRTSIDFLLWLSFVPGVSIICFTLAVLLVIGESLYTGWWLSYLLRDRQEIVRALQQQHQKDIQDITNFIADEIALELVQHAELTDSNGTLGGYYFRIARTCSLLDNIAEKARYQQELASKRLLLSQSEAQQTLYGSQEGNTWLDLHIRDEKMEMEKLTGVFKNLKQKLLKEDSGVRELAEFILRVTGVEKAVNIGQHFEETADDSTYQLDIFMQALVAVTMRFSIEPLSIENIEQLMEHYQDTRTYARETLPSLNTLLQMLNKQSSQMTLRSFSGQSNGKEDMLTTETTNSNIAVTALATWGQLFWQENYPSLEQILQQDGVLAHLQRIMQNNYDPRAVMRRLLAFTVFLGRSSQNSPAGDLYLLLAPSLQSRSFRQGLKNTHLPRIIDFPDVERILLLGIKRFVAEPLQLPAASKGEVELPDQEQAIATANDISA